MKNEIELDDLLEESLHRIEAGNTPQAVVAGLPEDAAGLASLVHLASAVRKTPYPVLSASAESATRKHITALAGEMASRNKARPAARWAWAFGISGVVAVFLCVFTLMAAAGGIWWYGPMAARSASLADASGQVQIASAGSAQWHAASAGQLVQAGDQVRTGADGNATLLFFDGSRSWLGPNSQISLEQLGGRWGNVLQVTLLQKTGSARYNVVPFQDAAARFQVDTPSGSASVHGTIFAINVDAHGQALYSVDRGNVLVANPAGQVAVSTGQATRSQPGQAPQPAAFRFSASQPLTSVNGSTWNVSGMSFDVSGETAISGNPQPGQIVFVTGRILGNHQWVADAITPGGTAGNAFQMTGTLQALQSGSVKLDGANLATDKTITVDPGIKVGDPVLVVYGADGKAASMIKLGETNDVAQSLCTGANPQPKGKSLAGKYGVSYDEIMGWFCQGFGFGEIDLAYGLSQETGASVADIFALHQQGLGWGEIKRRLQITATPVITASAEGSPTATTTANPAASSTPTPDLTASVTPAETVTGTPGTPVTGTPVGTQTTGCTGANPQPKGQSLANKYGVSYDEIMGWFCQGFGFGEIDLAYGLSLQTGTSVSDIFAMRASGLGWGQIEQKLAGQDHGKGKGKGKGKP